MDIKGAYPNGSLAELLFRVFRASGLAFEGVKRCGPFSLLDQRGEIPLGRSVLMRPQIIPLLVSEGKYDIGICGIDCVYEAGFKNKVTQLGILPFSRASFTHEPVKIALVGPHANGQITRQTLKGARILSEYPNLTHRYLSKLGISAQIFSSAGTTEAHIPNDFDYGVCLVETGGTLRSLGLEIVDVLLESYTVMIASPESLANPAMRVNLRELAVMLQATAERLTV